MSKPTNIKKRIAQRWLSLTAAGLVAGTLVFALLDPLAQIATPLRALARASPHAPLLLASTLTAVACWWIGRGRWLGFLGIRRLHRYPPLWIAIAIALATIALLLTVTSQHQLLAASTGTAIWAITRPAAFIPAAAILLSLAVIDTARHARSKSALQHDAPSRAADPSESVESLKAWLADDREVTHPDLDRFEHKAIARRIANRLTSNEEDDLPTMAIVGPVGSGKSTIRALTEHYLGNNPNIQLIPVSLWPYGSAEAASAGILDKTIETLAKQVNTLALTGVPSRYATSIKHAGGYLATIADLLTGDADPETILKRIENVAITAGIRLVLWIEDLERFSASTNQSPTIEQLATEERTAPILSLLHLLDRCRNITVIIADTSLRSRIDIEKIARFVDQLPAMEPNRMWPIIERFRQMCLAGNIIDPAADKYRNLFRAPNDELELLIWRFDGPENGISLPNSIEELVATPRILKFMLRNTLEFWDILPGEVDLDTLLIAHILKTARPELFAIANDFRQALRAKGPKNESGTTSRSGESDLARNSLEHLLKAEQSPRTEAALRTLLFYLFPFAGIADIKFAGITDTENKPDVLSPQRLGRPGRTDYWARCFINPYERPEVPDQAVLNAIDRFKSEENDTELVEMALDATRHHVVETFATRLDKTDLQRLFLEICEHLALSVAHSPQDRGVRFEPLFFFRRLYKATGCSIDNFKSEILQIISNHTKDDLPLIQRVIELFEEDRYGMGEIKREISNTFSRSLVAAFRTNPAGLKGARKRGHYDIVFELALLVSDDNTTAGPGTLTALPSLKWRDFFEVLLDFAEGEPPEGAALIVPFVCQPYLPSKEASKPPSFRRDLAERFFDYDRLLRILRRAEPPDDAPPAIAARVRVAQEFAARAFAENQ